MNISKVISAVDSEDLSLLTAKYLLSCRSEFEHLDYKVSLDITTAHEKACFAKDMLSMKNVGGGYVLVGVRDKTWEPVGLSAPLPYDSKQLIDAVRKASGVNLEIAIVNHAIEIDGEKRFFALILVRASAKRTKRKVPSVVSKDYHPSETWGLRSGQIFVRDSDSNRIVKNENELFDLLTDLDLRYSESDMKYKDKQPSPYAIESGLYRILPKDYESFIGRQQYKKKVKEALETDPRIWIVNLYGPGGVGKSAIATWAAYEYYSKSSEFESIIHYSAKSEKLEAGIGVTPLRPTLYSLEDFLDKMLYMFAMDDIIGRNIDVKKHYATEILEIYKVLVILDNMETVSDGRIMKFIQSLPPANRSKVLLTSRRRTSSWEYPLQVKEFDKIETKEYIYAKTHSIKNRESIIKEDSISAIHNISGGLPLAVQWIIGEFSQTGDLKGILRRAVDSSSPLLEFSFRNSWEALDSHSREALAVLSIFTDPPTSTEWGIALDWSQENVEKSVEALLRMTFVTERTDENTGMNVYSALPITLTFARNELSKYGDLELVARKRYNKYKSKIELEYEESEQYKELYDRFDVKSDNDKKAIQCARMAEGYSKSYKYEQAAEFFNKSLEYSPRSVYALVAYGLHLSEIGQLGKALEMMETALKMKTRKTEFYIYNNAAKVYDMIGDKKNRLQMLQRANSINPDDVIVKHSYGVSLSQIGRYTDALCIFDEIIDEELSSEFGPTATLAYAYCTKIITMAKSSQIEEAKIVATEAKKRLNEFNLDTYEIDRQCERYL